MLVAGSLLAIGAGAFILSKIDPGFSDFMGAASVKVRSVWCCCAHIEMWIFKKLLQMQYSGAFSNVAPTTV